MKNRSPKSIIVLASLTLTTVLIVITVICFSLSSDKNWTLADPFEFVEAQLNFKLPEGWEYNQEKSISKTTDIENKVGKAIYYESELKQNNLLLATIEGFYQGYNISGLDYNTNKKLFLLSFPNEKNKGNTSLNYDEFKKNKYVLFGNIDFTNNDASFTSQNPIFGEWYLAEDKNTQLQKFVLEILLDNGFLQFTIKEINEGYKITPEFIDNLLNSIYLKKSAYN